MRDLAQVRALPRPLAALAVCLFGLGGCGLFGGNAPSGTAVSQGPAALTDMPTIAMIAPPDPFGITPVGPEAILDPLAAMDDRITALEGAMASLTGNIDLRLPAIDRMIGIEADIRVLLTQLAQLADTSPPPAAAAAAPIEAPGPAQAPPGLAAIGPPEVGAGQELPSLAAVEPPTPAAAPGPAEIGPPMAIVPVEPVAEAPLAPMPAPAPPGAPAPPPPVAELAPAPAPVPLVQAPAAAVAAPPALAPTGGLQRGVHLASYRQRSSLENGWAVLRATHSDLLAGMQFRVSETTVPGQGTFYRLVAGPFPDPDIADRACQAIEAGGGFCKVVDFDGL